MCGWEEKADRFKSEKNLDNFIGHRQDFDQCLLFCSSLLFFFFLRLGMYTAPGSSACGHQVPCDTGPLELYMHIVMLPAISVLLFAKVVFPCLGD